MRERILFVCTANVDRSPTAEFLYLGDPRYEVHSAGTAPFATNPVTREMLQLGEPGVRDERARGPPPHPDQDALSRRGPRPSSTWTSRTAGGGAHPELVNRLLQALKPHLGEPVPPEDLEGEQAGGR